MTYDFFANKSDKLQLLNFIFNETDLRVFDLASQFGQEVSEYKETTEISTKFDLENGGQSSATFQLWTKSFGGDILFRKIELNPKSSGGHTFRYSTDGWSLVQLYFGGQKDNILYPSHLGHFNEKGALKWQDTNHFNGKVDKWNWKEIEQTSRKLKNYLHNRIAVRKIGSCGVLPGASELSDKGIKLWGTQP
jgi:hypothetical protein